MQKRGCGRVTLAAGLQSDARRCAAAVYRTTDTANIANATMTAVLFDNEEEDTDAFHDNSSNTSQLTVPVSGWYVVTCQVGWDSNATGPRGLFIIKNGTDTGANRIASEFRTAAGSDAQCVAGEGVLTAGEYVEAYVYQGSGANRVLVTSTRARFAIHLHQLFT